MPYVSAEDRAALDTGAKMKGPGDLNYKITQLIVEYLADHRPLKYQIINDVVGALEGAKQEFYRRVATPYENSKLAQNGDVYVR